MQRRAVVVVLHSQSDLIQTSKKPCWHCSAAETTFPVCSQCHCLQPLPDPAPTYFELFAINESLGTSDSEFLQTKFHALSKLLHPDRFIHKDAREIEFSLRWSTLLNRAYRTLKDASARAQYLLSLHGIELDKNAKIPVDLAETYFELQDALTESNRDQELESFQKTIGKEKDHVTEQWDNLSKLPTPISIASLKNLSELLVRKRFLDSMEADLLKRISHS